MKHKNLKILTISCCAATLILGGLVLITRSNNNSEKQSNLDNPIKIQNNNIKCLQVNEYEYRLEATVYPEYNFNKSVFWDVSFADSNSSWAEGKDVNDYISLNVDEKDSTKCTIRLLGPFGEQILITCSSTNYPEINASCTIDYEKKVTSVELTMNAGDVGENSYIKEGCSLLSSYTVEYSPVYSLDKTYSNLRLDTTISLKGYDPQVTTINYDYTGKRINFECVLTYLRSLLNSSTKTFSTDELMTLIKNDYDADILLGNENLEEKDLYIQKLKETTFTITGKLYNGNTYLKEDSKDMTLKLKDVTNLTLNQSSIIF